VNLSRTVRSVVRLQLSVGGVFLMALLAAGEARAQLAYPPDYGAASDQTLRRTVAGSGESAADKPADDHAIDGAQTVNTLREIFAAIRECWEPPPPEKSRPGMEYTVRFAFRRDGELMAPPHVTYVTHDVPDDVRDVYREAVEATFKRCTPMHFTASMASAIAGRPMGYRFFDNRIMIEQFKGGDNSGK
jgi:hypothetical protein